MQSLIMAPDFFKIFRYLSTLVGHQIVPVASTEKFRQEL